MKDKWKKVRKLMGYSIEDVSKRTNINRVTISNYERGISNIADDKLKKMVEAIGCSLDINLKIKDDV
jgi:transcriptional regulator with XRE-family HTH domain